MERKHKKDLVRKLKSLKLKHNYLHEIKWNRVSPSSSEFYSDVVDFFLNNELRFWSIIVNKEEVDHDKFHQ